MGFEWPEFQRSSLGILTEAAVVTTLGWIALHYSRSRDCPISANELGCVSLPLQLQAASLRAAIAIAR